MLYYFRPRRYPSLILLTALALSAAGVGGVFRLMRFDVLRSDALGYWQDSLNLAAPFHPYHVPGYPFVVALLRGLTLNLLPPQVVMQVAALMSFAAAVWLVYRILLLSSASPRAALPGGLLFMLWPMVGVTYVLYPVADALALALFLGGVYLHLKGLPGLAALPWAGALFTHKAMWVVVGLCTVVLWLRSTRDAGRKLAHLALMVAPLLVYFILGALHHNNPLWMLHSNLGTEVASRSGLPVLDGVLGTLLGGGLKGLVKGGLALLVLLLAVVSTWGPLKKDDPAGAINLGIGLGLLLLAVLLNQYEIWAAVRFGRLLVLPLAALPAVRRVVDAPALNGRRTALLAALGVGLLASQLFYAWYMGVYFSGGQ